MRKTGGSSTEDRAKEKSREATVQLLKASAYILAVVVDQGPSRNKTQEELRKRA